MFSAEQRAAALANQRAAAFIRFQMLGDHEAMSFILRELEGTEQLSFVTALASLSATIASKHMGEDGAMDYFRMVAETSASLAEPLD
ncbi:MULTISPECIES: hypothetical protein [Kineosporia]|uniref:Uncharacterized protein n=1 Tax=Kineosporia mesophila TaxID=566012 RepID=A0ABP7A5U8_9ACTN|nr:MULTISPECIES: hypothetical protein [Kineosporia]MCD5351522.1 hypothetical protein [Kineosporia mesophila]GLY32771.1 hypothetical protein Kisp02_61360 [Kineosporia sp. NBRC 101731]